VEKKYFSWVVLALFLAIYIYISWVRGWLYFIVLLAFYGVLFYWWHILLSKFRKKEFMNWWDFGQYFAYRISILLIFITWLLSFFVYYENIYEPAMMPEFTLSNGDKTVVFQWMAHIWSNKFYNTIIDNITNYKKQGYVLFFEWVKLWTKESSDKFNKLMWVQFDKKTYAGLSKIYWLRSQNNDEFLNLVNNKDYRTDASMDDIVASYEKKYWKINLNIPSKTWVEPINVWEKIDELVNQITDKELQLLIAINRAVMNLVIKNTAVQNTIMKWAGQQDLFDIILNDRNKIIVKSINESKDKKIVLLYWLMHFDWVRSQLQKWDPKWQIKNIRYFQPIN